MSKKQQPVYVCDNCHQDIGDNLGYHFDLSNSYGNYTRLYWNKKKALDFDDLEDKNFCCTKCLLNYLEQKILNNIE